MTRPAPDDDLEGLEGLEPWIRRERARQPSSGFADRVSHAVRTCGERRPAEMEVETPRLVRWGRVAAVILAVPVFLGRLVALVLPFLS